MTHGGKEHCNITREHMTRGRVKRVVGKSSAAWQGRVGRVERRLSRALKDSVCRVFWSRIPGFWYGSMGSVLHERVVGRVFVGVMGNWSDGGARAFGGLARAQGLFVQASLGFLKKKELIQSGIARFSGWFCSDVSCGQPGRPLQNQQSHNEVVMI